MSQQLDPGQISIHEDASITVTCPVVIIYFHTEQKCFGSLWCGDPDERPEAEMCAEALYCALSSAAIAAGVDLPTMLEKLLDIAISAGDEWKMTTIFQANKPS